MDKINDQVHDLNLSDNFSDRFNRLDLSPSGGPCVLWIDAGCPHHVLLLSENIIRLDLFNIHTRHAFDWDP